MRGSKMGIVEKELASFEISDGRDCRIELNADGIIHLHIGHTRLDFSQRKFNNFASVISKARLELQKQKK